MFPTLLLMEQLGPLWEITREFAREAFHSSAKLLGTGLVTLLGGLAAKAWRKARATQRDAAPLSRPAGWETHNMLEENGNEFTTDHRDRAA